MALFSKQNKEAFTNPLNLDHPILMQVLGMCVSSNAIYFSFHDQIVKTDWYGRFIKRAENLVKHQGDI